jgi:hypothetical protein
MKNIPYRILAFSFLSLFFLLTLNVNCTTYTWDAGTSNNWSSPDSWSPNGIPSDTDIVIVEGTDSYITLKNDISCKNLLFNSGTIDLSGYSLTILNTSSFNGGEITNGNLIISDGVSVDFAGSTFNCIVHAIASNIYFANSTFNDSLIVEKNGNANNSSKGGNTFNGYTSLLNSRHGTLELADEDPDIFNGYLTVTNSDTGKIYLAQYARYNEFNGDVEFNGTNIYSNYYGSATYSGNLSLGNCPNGNIFFGYGGGDCSIDTGMTIRFDGSITHGLFYFKNFTYLDRGALNFTFTNSAQVYFESGTHFYCDVTWTAPGIHLDGASFHGAVQFENTGTADVLSLGGCHFYDNVTIIKSVCDTSYYILGNTSSDTYSNAATISNNAGQLNINRAVFNGSTTLQNYDSSTTDTRFFLAHSGIVQFKNNVTINNKSSGICFSQKGSTTLDSSKTMSFTSGFSGKITLDNFTQLGTTSQTFNFPSETAKLVLDSNVTFNGNFSFTGINIEVNSSTFNGSMQVTKYGQSDMIWLGGNTFNGTTTIKDSSSIGHYLQLGDSLVDYYNSNVSFIEKGDGSLFPASKKTSHFKGNITVDGTSAITFGTFGGKVVVDGTAGQSINKSGSYAPVFSKVTINKSSNSFTLNTPISISDSLIFQKGLIYSDTSNIITLLNGGISIGATDTSFVNGPFKKVGNQAFIFPVGKNISYGFRPLEITDPTTFTDSYTAQYFNTGQTLGSALDTSIEHLNTCEFWELKKNSGSSNVYPKITWNHSDCEIINPEYMRVVAWNGSMWQNLGNQSYDGDSINGSILSNIVISTNSKITTCNVKCIYFKDIVTKRDINCYGVPDGVASVTVSGGTSPYYYSWSDNRGNLSTTPDILSKGKYYISISDTLNCHITDSVTINEPDSIVVSYSNTNSTCTDSTGSATVNVLGGSGLIKYKWTFDDATTQSHSELSAGEYTVIVTDSNNCVSICNIQVKDSDGPEILLLSMHAVTCYGGQDGAAEIDVSTSKEPYSILWSTQKQDTIQNISGVRAGKYNVRVTDSLGCVSFETIEITQPDTFNLTVSTQNTQCGSHNGKAFLNVQGGVKPYIYTWMPDTSSVDSLINLNSGERTITVTDNNGCSISQNFEILDIEGMTVTGHVISNANCFLDTIGSARVTVAGGTAPYIYSWYPYGGNNDTAKYLISQNYTVKVIDANGCRQKTRIFIDGPDELKVYIAATHASSSSSNDANAIAIIYGGTSPYNNLWSNGSTNLQVNNLGVGIDSVTVTDNHGCTSTNFVQIKIAGCNDFFGGHTNFNRCAIIDTFTCSPCDSIVKNIKTDFGAVGNGVTDDECAFENATEFFRRVDSIYGNDIPKTLIIPIGTYLVGRQDLPSYARNSVLFFNHSNNITILGRKTYGIDRSGRLVVTAVPKLKIKSCMKFGLFDFPNFTQRLLLNGSCSDSIQFHADLGDIFRFSECRNVLIKDLELDGNIDSVSIGGANTQGIQMGYDGVVLNACYNATINNLNIHHFGRDGIILWANWCYPPPSGGFGMVPISNNIAILNSKCNFNGRNGLTWGGGIGLTATNCAFNYNGLNRLSVSNPGAGIDIEYELSNIPNRSGYFEQCEFKYNKNYGLICDAGQPPHTSLPMYQIQDYFSRDVAFHLCLFVSSQNGISVIPNSRNFLFDNCRLYGITQSAFYAPISFHHLFDVDNTKFQNCYFGEEFADPKIFPVTSKSFSSGPIDDVLEGPLRFNDTCPGGHRWLIEYPHSCRVEFTNCNIETNFTLLGVLLSSYTNPHLDSSNYNKISGTSFISYGLNRCNCEVWLGAFYRSHFKNPPNIFGSRGSLDFYNCDSLCITCTMRNGFDFPACLIDSLSIQDSIISVPFHIVPRYHDPVVPFLVTKLYADANETCPLLLDQTNDCDSGFFRIKNSNIQKIQENKIKVYPNPASDFLTIENGLNHIVKICNITGDIVFQQILFSDSYQIDIKKFLPGVYIIYVENANSSNSYKLIKI